MEWSPVYHVKGWGKFNRHYGDFCTGADNWTIQRWQGWYVACNSFIASPNATFEDRQKNWIAK